MTYKDIKLQHPENMADYNCFWAFDEKQYADELSKLSINKDDDDMILAIGDGLYGTREGYARLKEFYKNKRDMIRQYCTPQEVYDYEYENCECEWEEDDFAAANNVYTVFGIDVLGTIKRKHAKSFL